MSGVNIEYKGESIATIPDTGSKTLKTQGKYCEGDILVEYEAPPEIPIDENSLKPTELGVNDNGFYFGDTQGSGNDIAFGRNNTGVYVTRIGNDIEDPSGEEVYIAEKDQLDEQNTRLVDYNTSLQTVQGTLQGLSDLASRKQTKIVTPTITQQTITSDSGYSALAGVIVEPAPLESKTILPTSQQQVVTPTAPNVGLSSVTVGAAPQPTLITKQITANGTYAAEDETPPADGYREVEVDVPAPILHINRITVYNTPDTEMKMAGIKGLTDISIANNPNLEKIIGLDAGGVTTLNACFANSNHLMLLDWTPPLHLTYMGRAFENCRAITEINLAGTTFSAANWGVAFSECQVLVTIYGELDLSSCTNTGNTFLHCYALENVSFKANTIPISLSFGNSSLLTDNSIVNIANGLSESVSGQTLTLHADVKNKLSTILGTVALDDTQSYHVFTADSGGTVTLSEFITNTKGWSIA